MAARIDAVRPSLRDSWGGPLNGQPFRREIVRSLARAIDFDAVFETGTYRGSSTEFFAAVFGTHVETVEGNPRFYLYSRKRLRALPEVTVTLGDSREFLRNMVPRYSGKTVFVYLDAHWNADLPLAEECRIIAANWQRAVILIDDFQVPNDAGYGFDDYGPGRALTLDYLPLGDMPGWTVFFPSLPGLSEGGLRRGSCLLSSPDLDHLVELSDKLRRA